MNENQIAVHNIEKTSVLSLFRTLISVFLRIRIFSFFSLLLLVSNIVRSVFEKYDFVWYLYHFSNIRQDSLLLLIYYHLFNILSANWAFPLSHWGNGKERQKCFQIKALGVRTIFSSDRVLD